MTYAMYWKHADEIVRHESMIAFIEDYQEVIDNKGLEVWWEDPIVIGQRYVSGIQDWMEMSDMNVTVLSKLERDFDELEEIDDPTYKVTAEFFVKRSELRSS